MTTTESILERYEKQLDERTERQQRFALGDEGYRLYKAAPELLEALKLLFKAWDCNWIHPDERAQIYKQVLSAIERAEPKT